MKFNKIFIGLGVAGFALASCSDDVEYTPADPVNTPPVYFSMDDDSQVDLEEDAVYFPIKVYRQNVSDNTPGHVSLTLSAEDGSSVAGLFTIGKIVVKDAVDEAAGEHKIADVLDEEKQPTGEMEVFVPTGEFTGDNNASLSADVTVDFPAGVGEYDIALYFGNVGNLTQMLNYDFGVVAAGEASPYFITKVDYDVAYTPWENIDEGPVILRDFCLLAPSTAGRELEFEVTCQKHPIKKDFFRLIRPYANAGIGTYVLDMNDPNYLYINAGNATEVYFSDKRGDYLKQYDTGVVFYTDVDETIRIACDYCYNKLNEDLVVTDALKIPYANLAGAGRYSGGRISFGSNLTVLLPGIEGYWKSKGWTLVFPWATSEWEDLGKGMYTDGFITQWYEGIKKIPTAYPVDVQRHLEDAGRYRIIAPYAFGVWPSNLATPWDVTFDVVVDCNDPNFVILEEQTAFEDADGPINILNAGFAFTNYYGPQGENRPFTKDEVIEMEQNDTFDTATGTITFAHPVININEDGKYIFLDEKTTRWNTPGKLVLPTGDEPQEEAKSAAGADPAQVSYATMRK